MSELNREQIMKAMECCYNNNLSCLDCPFQETDKYIECSSLTISALALIKELTEENERLRSCVVSEEQVKTIAETTIKLGIDTIKADTVRKMQERLKEQFRDKFGYRSDYIHELIDIIAKEMLEGAENGT